MSISLEQLDIIDLISERHSLLRSRIDIRWNAQSDIHLANSEWYILSRIVDASATIAEISKTVAISRQAIHKFIRQLEQKGLINVFDMQDSKKLKGVEMTQLGRECYQRYDELKQEIITEIVSIIGEDNKRLFEKLLRQPWFKEAL